MKNATFLTQRKTVWNHNLEDSYYSFEFNVCAATTVLTAHAITSWLPSRVAQSEGVSERSSMHVQQLSECVGVCLAPTMCSVNKSLRTCFWPLTDTYHKEWWSVRLRVWNTTHLHVSGSFEKMWPNNSNHGRVRSPHRWCYLPIPTVNIFRHLLLGNICVSLSDLVHHFLDAHWRQRGRQWQVTIV